MLLGWVALWIHLFKVKKKYWRWRGVWSVIGSCCVKWGKEWHSTICREGVRFWTFDLFIPSSPFGARWRHPSWKLFRTERRKNKVHPGVKYIKSCEERSFRLGRWISEEEQINHPRQPTQISSLTGGDNWQILRCQRFPVGTIDSTFRALAEYTCMFSFHIIMHFFRHVFPFFACSICIASHLFLNTLV